MTRPEVLPIILASQSPRRVQLLAQLGLHCEALPADIDETPAPGEAPEVLVRRLALEKGAAIRAREAEDPRPVLAADTIVALDGVVLGKPRDRADALEMLQRLSGRTHEVLTAVALLPRGGSPRSVVDRSLVTFRTLGAGEAEAYWETGEPRDKAGAYGIQGRAGIFVTRLEGSYTGVMGLPLAPTAQLLAELGVALWESPS